MKSWKIGAIVGLIAGLFASLFVIYVFLPLEFPIVEIARNEIIFVLIWSIIFGVIFSKVHGLVPGKAISKGLIYSLFLFLLYEMRWVVHSIIYWDPNWIFWNALYGIFRWIPYGIVLGIVYEFLRNRYYPTKKELKIIEYDMKSGFYPGAIAGFFGGVATFVVQLTITYSTEELLYPGILIDAEFLISKLGGQIMFHLIFGIIIGLVFPKVYNLIPGKGIIKGLVYSLIAQFLIFEIQTASWFTAYGWYTSAHSTIFTGISQSIVYGLVLGLLYRKPIK